MTESPSLEERIAEHLSGMSPAEQRVARFFRENREEVLIASAAALAAKARTSDATVVRTAKTLGFSGLDGLRRALADELRGSLSPAERMVRTLGEVGTSPATAFEVTLDIHLRAIDDLRRSISAAQFEEAVESIVQSRRTLIFGIGPSSAMADYLAFQLTRFGFAAGVLTNTGLLFADDLRTLRKGDLMIMLAYGRVYAELEVLVDEVARHGLKALLVTDTLAGVLRGKVDMILPVARGRADMLSMHTATLAFLEALLVGVAAKRPDATLASLHALNAARERLAGKTAKLPTPTPERGRRKPPRP